MYVCPQITTQEPLSELSSNLSAHPIWVKIGQQKQRTLYINICMNVCGHLQNNSLGPNIYRNVKESPRKVVEDNSTHVLC
jgi:hypothetical protein